MEAEDLEQAERRLFRFQELECRLGLGSIWGQFRVKDKSLGLQMWENPCSTAAQQQQEAKAATSRHRRRRHHRHHHHHHHHPHHETRFDGFCENSEFGGTPTAHSFVKDDSRGALVKSHDFKSTHMGNPDPTANAGTMLRKLRAEIVAAF